MALRAALPAALLVGSVAAAAAQGALPNHPVPPFAPAAPSSGPSETWIFSGLLDDREPYSGTLLTGGDATEFELELGAGVSCTGGDATLGSGSVRLSGVTCSDDRTAQASFVSRGEAELTVFGQVGARRFATSAHRLGTEAPPQKPEIKARDAAPPPAAPPAGTTRPGNG